GLVELPLVDIYCELLWSLLARLFPACERSEKPFRFLLSCDVDHPWLTLDSMRSFVRACAASLIKRRDISQFLAVLDAYFRPRRNLGADPYYTFSYIMDQAEARGLRCAFYFIPGNAHPTFDGRYAIDDPRIRALM